MNLLALQRAFRDEIVTEDDGVAPTSLGMAIYRDAYRGRLLSTLEYSFERTRTWVGEDAFTAAACHYILTIPPRGWTLDDYGEGFPDVLGVLFAEDVDVAELAWLEWQMQRAFAAADAPTLTAAALAEAGYRDEEWDHLCFAMAPGFAMRPVVTDCVKLWEALESGSPNAVSAGPEGAALVIWRRGFSPHYRMVDGGEAQMLRALASGQRFGTLAVQSDPNQLGAALATWLSEGLLSSVTSDAVW